MLRGSPSADDEVERLRRLELAAGLLPALLRVLDVRGVFEGLSAIGRHALPHDMLTLGLFNGDFTRLTMFARTGQGDDLGRDFPQPYPPAVVRAWNFDIIDDRVEHPLERDRPPTRLGMRSSLAQVPQGVLHYLQRLYYDTALSCSPSALAALRNFVPASQIVFGSDFPFLPSPLATAQLAALENTGQFGEQEKAQIFRENALQLFPRFATTAATATAGGSPVKA